MKRELVKICPVCQRPMVIRVNLANGSEFYGCSGWPESCQHTEPLPEYVRLVLSGAAQLPGFGEL